MTPTHRFTCIMSKQQTDAHFPKDDRFYGVNPKVKCEKTN